MSHAPLAILPDEAERDRCWAAVNKFGGCPYCNVQGCDRYNGVPATYSYYDPRTRRVVTRQLTGSTCADPNVCQYAQWEVVSRYVSSNGRYAIDLNEATHQAAGQTVELDSGPYTVPTEWERAEQPEPGTEEQPGVETWTVVPRT